jgi:hypothetical protein
MFKGINKAEKAASSIWFSHAHSVELFSAISFIRIDKMD